MNIERNCQSCKYYNDGYCENLELKPHYPMVGCDDFEKIHVETVKQDLAVNKAINLLQVEPFTDIEQRIFLAAMSREEKVCKEVCKDGEGIDLVAVCHSIERKVKKALWS